MSTLTTNADQQARIVRTLSGVRHSVAGVRGILLASLDGKAIAADLDGQEERHVAAIVASSLGLGERLANLTGEASVSEIVVRSATGYVVIYSAGTAGAIIVLANPSINLALLHLKAREVTESVTEILT